MADAVEHRREIIFGGSQQRNGRILPVVNHVGTALGRPVFGVINTHASLWIPGDAADVDADAAQLRRERLRHRIRRQRGQVT
ncbi:hypothetical protein SDC9_209870 [bioreactor metagenome]|uniref:Uncharacterized protein n=1 Tax=bioreactor metagenome TaxID=1076179 RepID=A0A645JRP8_9ZZZZ